MPRTILLLLCLPLATAAVLEVGGASPLADFTRLQARQAEIPTPSALLGISVGGDGVLATYDQIVEYWKAIDLLSDRVTLQELGRTTMGRPYVAAVITSAENQKRLEAYRGMNNRLYDPRTTSEQEARALIAQGKTIVAIQMGIHSDEVAAPQLSLELAYRFATEKSPRMDRVLAETIIILSPSHNPDGTQLVAEWNRTVKGTSYEGGPLPFLYHKYVGHDNNRDWYMFTQTESRITVAKIWNAWHPQISYDLHQMEADGARIFVPPYLDPVNPHIDPILRAQTKALGSHMATSLLAQGKAGVVTHAIYDLWTPARAYVNYHGGVRILTEVANARLASPLTLSFSALRPGSGYDAQQASWNFPRPWRGGTWRLRDIMDYEHAAVDALLDHAARHRQSWLENFWRVNKNAVGQSGSPSRSRAPYALVIPATQPSRANADQMLDALQFGDVEIHRARAPFTAAGVHYPAGSSVILLAQPASAFATTLLEVQHYPDLRAYPGGPPRQPYDATAYTMPLLMGVEVARVEEPFEANLELVPAPYSDARGKVVNVGKGRAASAYAIVQDGAGIQALIRLLKDQVRIGWTRESFEWAGTRFAIGTIVVPVKGQPAVHDKIAAIAKSLPVTVYAADERVPAIWQIRLPRLGLYKSYAASVDEGWTRWIFDRWSLPYSTLENRDISRARALRSRFDVIVLPDQSVGEIVSGIGPGQVPPEYAGGIGEEGVAALKTFVEEGGTLVALDSASILPIERFKLPVENIADKLSSSDLFGPGSILRTRVDTTHPIGFGSPPESIAWFEASPAFRVSENARAVVSYPARGQLLLSGWLLGGERLNGSAAVVEAPFGRGRVVLFGFRPQYRAQTWATFGLFFNSLFYSTINDSRQQAVGSGQ